MTSVATSGYPSEQRLRSLCDLNVAYARDRAGWHGYDGVVQDLSPDGVRAQLRGIGVGQPLADQYDERLLAAAEAAERVRLGELELHRWNPRVHLANLDLGVYERPYAPVEERLAARKRHLDGWPDAIDAACQSLDAVPAVVAQALLSSARGLTRGVTEDEAPQALAAHTRLIEHLERAASSSEVDPARGGRALAALLGAVEALDVDLGTLAGEVADERARSHAMLEEACGRILPGLGVREAVAALQDDHPAAADMISEAQALTAMVVAFVGDRRLLDYPEGECRVRESPPSRRWATASLVWSAPHEPDGPSWYYVTPPDPAWSESAQRQWLTAFSRSTLPSTTVHEVAPGHFAHGRLLRAAGSEVRSTLHSPAFVEGWAHYAEELCAEEGFGAGDGTGQAAAGSARDRYSAGVALKALLRVVRAEVAIGVHTGALTIPEAVVRFTEDAYLRGPVASTEAHRALHDPGYGRYTWGKLAIMALRQQARDRWGAAFCLRRFHNELLGLGAPPLGLMDAILESPGEVADSARASER